MKNKMIITRFAPSPTGMLHIGSARTALFNLLYSKHCNGKFLLRIEDTDRERSTNAATQQVIESLKWLKIDWNDEIIIQSERIDRHKEIAHELVKQGKAYYCYMTQNEIEQQKSQDQFAKVNSPWRNSQENPPSNVQPVVRMKFPQSGITSFDDVVQGTLAIQNSELTDIIILRSDGTPTYLLAVVVDDHDANVNYVIRGDDHITNTFKQILIYQAMNWGIPKHAHIPLIHGEDGSKLSKRHGALGVEYYRDSGYLPEALCNYLLRLGWGGDGKQEILSRHEAIEIFDIADVSKSPARFDLNKLNFINAHYIQNYDEDELFELAIEFWHGITTDEFMSKARRAITLFKVRCNTLVEIANMFSLLIEKSPLDEKSQQILTAHCTLLDELKQYMHSIEDWTLNGLKQAFSCFAQQMNMKENIIMQCLRAGILGTFTSPGIYDMMVILSKQDCMKRISDA